MNQQELFDKFWQFYYEKHAENHSAASEDIVNLNITELDIIGDVAIIKLRRPGLIIGPKGDNICALRDFLGIELRVEEEPTASIADQIIPWCFDDFEDYNRQLWTEE